MGKAAKRLQRQKWINSKTKQAIAEQRIESQIVQAIKMQNGDEKRPIFFVTPPENKLALFNVLERIYARFSVTIELSHHGLCPAAIIRPKNDQT